MTAPDRIYLRSIGAEAPIMYASEAGSDDGQCEGYIKLSLYNELMAQRDAAVAALVNARHDLWMKTNIHVAVLLEAEADRETDKSIAAGSRRMDNLADMHGYTARAFRREAKTLRGQLAKKKVPLNFLE